MRASVGRKKCTLKKKKRIKHSQHLNRIKWFLAPAKRLSKNNNNKTKSGVFGDSLTGRVGTSFSETEATNNNRKELRLY